MAIVSDGHGSDKYFRSDRGSKFLVNVTKDAIRAFVKNKDSLMFRGKGEFSSELAESNSRLRDTLEHQALTNLFSQIICNWNQLVEYDAMHEDFTEWEMEHVSETLRNEFIAKRNDAERLDGFEKTYGCTLIAYFQTSDYWVAFQIGDGKLVALKEDANTIVCTQPIPWDKNCFLNRTTSICDATALEEFRYCYGRKADRPLGVFLGSDGIDDTFGDGAMLYNFYLNLMKNILYGENENVTKLLERQLPEISKRGSQDDMSIASVTNIKCVTRKRQKELHKKIIAWQIDYTKRSSDRILSAISNYDDKIAPLENISSPTTAQSAELSIAKAERENLVQQLQQSDKKIKSLRQELKRK